MLAATASDGAERGALALAFTEILPGRETAGNRENVSPALRRARATTPMAGWSGAVSASTARVHSVALALAFYENLKKLKFSPGRETAKTGNLVISLSIAGRVLPLTVTRCCLVTECVHNIRRTGRRWRF